MIQPWTSEDQRYQYDLTPQDVVVDAGGFEGDWTDRIVRRYGCRSILLEPVPEFFKNCAERFALEPRVRCLNFALFNQNRPLRMGLSNNSSGIKSSGDTWITVGGITFSELLKLVNLDRVALLKLNIETAEFPVLANIIEEGLMPRIDRLQIQWHSVEGFDREYGMLRQKILATHDHIWGANPLFWESYELKK